MFDVIQILQKYQQSKDTVSKTLSGLCIKHLLKIATLFSQHLLNSGPEGVQAFTSADLTMVQFLVIEAFKLPKLLWEVLRTCLSNSP